MSRCGFGRGRGRAWRLETLEFEGLNFEAEEERGLREKRQGWFLALVMLLANGLAWGVQSHRHRRLGILVCMYL